MNGTRSLVNRWRWVQKSRCQNQNCGHYPLSAFQKCQRNTATPTDPRRKLKRYTRPYCTHNTVLVSGHGRLISYRPGRRATSSSKDMVRKLGSRISYRPGSRATSTGKPSTVREQGSAFHQPRPARLLFSRSPRPHNRGPNNRLTGNRRANCNRSNFDKYGDIHPPAGRMDISILALVSNEFS